MTADALRCDKCGDMYLVPASLISDAFEQERLLDWQRNHPCGSASPLFEAS